MTEKTLKQRIHNGDTIVGVNVPIWTDPDRLKAIFDKRPYDFVYTDVQHAAFNEQQVVAFCEAVDELGVPVKLRIKHTRHAYLIGNYLDLGPSGVEVPQVELETTVDEAIASLYYSPIGNRSWGEPRKGPQVPTDRVEYARWWSEYGLLWLQLETIEGVTNARRLAKAGVDCLSFGPNDLTFSLEAHPHHPLKTVADCVRNVAQQLADSSVAVCFRTTPETREKYAEMGVTVFLEKPIS